MTTKFLLTEDELPSHWYNILADVPEPLGAFLSPRTLEPLTPPDLTPIFPMAIIGQEVSSERWIEIPDRVRDIYKLWRPTPLYRAEPGYLRLLVSPVNSARSCSRSGRFTGFTR